MYSFFFFHVIDNDKLIGPCIGPAKTARLSGVRFRAEMDVVWHQVPFKHINPFVAA
jgi:hypothetical protein